MGDDISISVVIPVLHEAGNINGLIDHLRRLPGGREIEIIVIDGAPEEDTLNAIDRRGIRKLRSGKGRGVQMNLGARSARGDVLLFLHADTFLPENGLELIRRTMDDHRFSGGAFTIRLDRINPVLGALIFIHDLRGLITRVPYGDQAIFVRRKHYYQAGGFPHWPLMEDVALVRCLNGIGKFGLASGFVRTSARRWKQETILFTTLRNWSLLLRYFCGVSPHRLFRHYDHKR